MNDGEHALWDRWRQRHDDRAFEALVAPHLSFAAAFARRLGLAQADADDVVQGSLVRLAQERGERPARVGLRAWLGREVLQGTRMAFRAAHRRTAHERAVPAPAGASAQPLEVHDEVERALATLPEQDRRAVELRFLHDLEYREIAHVLGTSALACRLRVHRALGRLRQRLGPNAPMRVAALPMLGLSTHARSLIEGIAGAHVATSAVAGGALLMGAGTKAAIAAVLVAGGIGLWYALPESAPARPAAPLETAAESLERPSLAGREGGPALAATPVAPTVPVETSQAARPGGPPLDTPIPPGTGSVSGRVRFTDGVPARDLRLALLGSPAVEVVTDDEGRFHIHGDWVANRILHVAGPRRYEFGLTEVQLVADKRVEVDVTIERGVALEGVLLAKAAREPVPKILVTLRRPGVGNGTQGVYGWVETDEAGKFRFDLLPAGAYTLEVDDLTDLEARTFAFEVRTEFERREFLLEPARHIRVRLENVPDIARGSPLTWEWERADRATVTDGNLTVITDHVRPHGRGTPNARGELRVIAPPQGTWTLMLEGRPTLPELVERKVVVTADGPEEVVVRIPDGASVAGTVRDASGQPLAGATVQAAEKASAKADAEGRFTIPWVAAGPTQFSVREEGLTTLVGRADVPTSGTARVELALPGRGSIALRIVDVPEVNWALVTLTYPDARGVHHGLARPNSRGEFRFRHLAAGVHQLLIHAGSRLPYRAEITLRPDEERDLGDIRFAEPVDVPVELIVPKGTKVPAVIGVTASPIEEGGRMSVAVNVTIVVAPDGTAVLRGLPPGLFYVTVGMQGLDPVKVTVKIEGPRPDPVRVEFAPRR